MDDIKALDGAIRLLLRGLSIDERRTPTFAGAERMGLLDMETISLIAERPDIQARDLIGILGLKPTTMQSVIDRLVKRNLVRRDAGKLKGRAIALSLTAKGRQLAQDIHAHNLNNCAMLLAALEPAERPGFVRNMVTMSRAIAQNVPESATPD